MLKTCESLGLHVPEEVAILGAGNDPLECEISSPPLSSIRLPTRRIGRRAAALVKALIGGAPAPAKAEILQPLNVVGRASTALSTGDEQLKEVIDFLRRHLDEPITVSYAARRLGIGRRRLERRFADCFGWGPGEQLMRLRIERARQLLVDTDSPISRIAAESGFSCPA